MMSIFMVFFLFFTKGISPTLAEDAIEIEQNTVDINLGEDKQGLRTGNKK